MRMIAKVLSAIALGLTLLPSVFVFTGDIPWALHANLMLGGTVLWFITAPFWMKRE